MTLPHSTPPRPWWLDLDDHELAIRLEAAVDRVGVRAHGYDPELLVRNRDDERAASIIDELLG